MIPDRTWRQFVNAPENKKLSLSEQKRKYSDERKRFDQQNQFFVHFCLFNRIACRLLRLPYLYYQFILNPSK